MKKRMRNLLWRLWLYNVMVYWGLRRNEKRWN